MGLQLFIIAVLATAWRVRGCDGAFELTTGHEPSAHAARCGGTYDIWADGQKRDDATSAGRHLYRQRLQQGSDGSIGGISNSMQQQPCVLYYFHHLKMWLLGLRRGHAPVFAWAQSDALTPDTVPRGEWGWYDRKATTVRMLPHISFRRCKAAGGPPALSMLQNDAPALGAALKSAAVAFSIKIMGYVGAHFDIERRELLRQAVADASRVDYSIVSVARITTIYFEGMGGEQPVDPSEWAPLGADITVALAGRGVTWNTVRRVRSGSRFRGQLAEQLRLHGLEVQDEGGAVELSTPMVRDDLVRGSMPISPRAAAKPRLRVHEGARASRNTSITESDRAPRLAPLPAETSSVETWRREQESRAQVPLRGAVTLQRVTIFIFGIALLWRVLWLCSRSRKYRVREQLYGHPHVDAAKGGRVSSNLRRHTQHSERAVYRDVFSRGSSGASERVDSHQSWPEPILGFDDDDDAHGDDANQIDKVWNDIKPLLGPAGETRKMSDLSHLPNI